MIDNITSCSPWVVVNGNYAITPYIPQTDKPMQGVVRMVNNTYQVYDGAAWISFYGSSATVNLSPQAQKILD